MVGLLHRVIECDFDNGDPEARFSVARRLCT